MNIPPKDFVKTFRVIPKLSGTAKLDYKVLAEANRNAKIGNVLSNEQKTAVLNQSCESLARGFRQANEEGKDLTNHSLKLKKGSNLVTNENEEEVLKQARLKRLFGKPKTQKELSVLNNYHNKLDTIV